MSFDIQVRRRLGDSEIVTSFNTPSGLTALFGPSGAGKTSILNMVAGLLKPDGGHIIVNGEVLFESAKKINVAPERRHSGYVFQDGRLFPHMRVRDNLLFGAMQERSDHQWMTLESATDFLGIGHLLDRWPRTLSGGEAQRIVIGRALLSRPRFLLMDEPLSSLDRARREEIIQVIERVRDTITLPILYVSHDRNEVERLADNIVDIG